MAALYGKNLFALPNLRPYTKHNKNLAIANRSRVSRARDLEIYVKGHSRSLETEPLDRSYTTYC